VPLQKVRLQHAAARPPTSRPQYAVASGLDDAARKKLARAVVPVAQLSRSTRGRKRSREDDSARKKLARAAVPDKRPSTPKSREDDAAPRSSFESQCLWCSIRMVKPTKALDGRRDSQTCIRTLITIKRTSEHQEDVVVREVGKVGELLAEHATRHRDPSIIADGKRFRCLVHGRSWVRVPVGEMFSRHC
jgi:hypothetical protein